MPLLLVLALLLVGCGSEQTSVAPSPAARQTLLRSSDVTFRYNLPGYPDHARATVTDTSFSTDFRGQTATDLTAHLAARRVFQDLEAVEVENGQTVSRRSLRGSRLRSLQLDPAGLLAFLEQGVSARAEAGADVTATTAADAEAGPRMLYIFQGMVPFSTGGVPQVAQASPFPLGSYSVRMETGSAPQATLKFAVGGSLPLLEYLQSTPGVAGYVIRTVVGGEDGAGFVYYAGVTALSLVSNSSAATGDEVVLQTAFLELLSETTQNFTPQPKVYQSWFPSTPQGP